MDSLYELKDLLCDEIEDIVEKNDITPTELERAYKAVDIIKDIETIDAMKNSEFSGYSYDEGYAYARGHDSYCRRGFGILNRYYG